ncbi:hypothetical protein MUK42_18520 [Musa troglodytarum]|uniref:Uncharacterized protein n=1 Tax=Musa troglodytarum TaxID=320322 RepID=A0A9E7G4R7_9LILI|nr:hypothetical protein MUK42_18520 [Musa troglodytarum]
MLLLWAEGHQHDLEVLAPVPHLIDAVAHGVADVERLHGAIEEVRYGTVDGNRRSVVTEEDHPELLLAHEEGVEKPPHPGDGKDLVIPGGEVVEEVGDLPLEGDQLPLLSAGVVVALVGIHGWVDGVIVPEAQDREGGERERDR